MSIYPVITEKKQELYEKMYSDHTVLQNKIPVICGYYGRACRQMGDIADRVLCIGNSCTLSVFISTVEEILECINKKEAVGIESLHDSDIRDIQERLKKNWLK